MVKVVLDKAMIEKLHGLKSPIMLCDESGEMLARVVPSDIDPKMLEPQISDEELEERYKNPGRLYTTEEVLAHLRSL
jgi:hypothetical protein